MGPKHERTLKAIFEDPVRSNIAWRDIEAMLESAGYSATDFDSIHTAALLAL